MKLVWHPIRVVNYFSNDIIEIEVEDAKHMGAILRSRLNRKPAVSVGFAHLNPHA